MRYGSTTDQLELRLRAWGRQRAAIAGVCGRYAFKARSDGRSPEDDPTAYQGDRAVVTRLVALLATDLREVVRLHYTDPRPAERKADFLGIARAEYYARLSTARDALRASTLLLAA
jgi:DNA-directed RNA polymerase specialized sigma24 family protein